MNELDARVRGKPLTLDELAQMKGRSISTIRKWIAQGTVEKDKLTGLVPLESALKARPPGAFDSGTASPHFNSAVGSGGTKGGKGETKSKREKIVEAAEAAMLRRRKAWARLKAEGQDDTMILAELSWMESRS